MVCAAARRIRENENPPTVQRSFEFGNDYGRYQMAARVAAVFCAYLLITSLLIMTNVIHESQNVAYAGTLIGGLGGMGVCYGMGLLSAAKANATRHLECKERWSWNVCQLAREIQTGDHAIEKVREFGRQYGSLRMITLALAIVCFISMLVGVCAYVQPLIKDVNYPAAFAVGGFCFISCVWTHIKLNEARTTVRNSLHLDADVFDAYGECASWIWSRC